MARLSRDEIISIGLQAAEEAKDKHSPWIYYAKVKVGRGKTKNVEGEYYNLRHLKAELLMKHAVEDAAIHIYGIARIMKAQLRSQQEDI